MRKSLSRKVTEILFLTSIGVIGYTAIDTSTVYAQTIGKGTKVEANIKQNKEKKTNKILNITEVQYGKFYTDNNEYRINYTSDENYEKAISEVLVNGKEYLEEKEQYSIHYYGMKLDPTGFTKYENKIVIKANGYNDIEMIIKKDGTLIDYKEIVSEAPLLNIGDNIKMEEGQPINLLLGVSAKDKKDGDITGNIKVNKGELDINKPSKGIYTIIYSITNSSGKTVTKSL